MLRMGVNVLFGAHHAANFTIVVVRWTRNASGTVSLDMVKHSTIGILVGPRKRFWIIINTLKHCPSVPCIMVSCHQVALVFSSPSWRAAGFCWYHQHGWSTGDEAHCTGSIVVVWSSLNW